MSGCSGSSSSRAAHAPRASLVLKGDLRPGHDTGQLQAKVSRVESKLTGEWPGR